jgi:AraC-like DNA-binding protein
VPELPRYPEAVDRAQAYEERLPLPALAARVRTVWVQRTGPRPVLQRNLPTGGAELQCPIGATPLLVGPLTRAKVEVLPAGLVIVGARFWPGAASPLLGVPADELADQVVPFHDVWDAASDLSAQLAAAPGPDAALRLLQLDLVRRLARTPSPDSLVAEAVRRLMPWRPMAIGPLTEDLAISESQLRRRFLAEVGIGPKTLQRALRFQGYLALAQAARPGSRVADLAADVGYADHAHLGRECLRLTGLTPRALLGDASGRCGCGHDHAASYGPFLAARHLPRLRTPAPPAASTPAPPTPILRTGRPPSTAGTPTASGRSSAATIRTGCSASHRRSEDASACREHLGGCRRGGYRRDQRRAPAVSRSPPTTIRPTIAIQNRVFSAANTVPRSMKAAITASAIRSNLPMHPRYIVLPPTRVLPQS